MEYSVKGVNSLIKDIISQDVSVKTQSGRNDLLDNVIGRDKYKKELDSSLNNACNFDNA